MVSFREVGRSLLILAAILAAIGATLYFSGRLPFRLGRLPGDIMHRGEQTTFYFPLVTCLIVSVALSLALWLDLFISAADKSSPIRKLVKLVDRPARLIGRNVFRVPRRYGAPSLLPASRRARNRRRQPLFPHTFAQRLLALPALDKKFSAADRVTLGRTGIATSRLAMGTGTVGSGHHSHQTALGVDGLSRLLLNGYDQGLHLFDAADSYGSHPHVAEALQHIDRGKVTILTKSWARDPAEMRADLDRFRRELRIDYIDLFLMHCLTEPDWTTRYRPVMDVLEEAKHQGIIRAHGCSRHSIEAFTRRCVAVG